MFAFKGQGHTHLSYVLGSVTSIVIVTSMSCRLKGLLDCCSIGRGAHALHVHVPRLKACICIALGFAAFVQKVT